jgi:hypothetical protein
VLCDLELPSDQIRSDFPNIKVQKLGRGIWTCLSFANDPNQSEIIISHKKKRVNDVWEPLAVKLIKYQVLYFIIIIIIILLHDLTYFVLYNNDNPEVLAIVVKHRLIQQVEPGLDFTRK